MIFKGIAPDKYYLFSSEGYILVVC